QAVPLRVAGRKGLFDVLDAVPGERLDVLERLVELPGLVHVHLERKAGDASDRTDALHVEPVACSELQLEALEAVTNPLRPARQVVGVAQPDRPGGRRARTPEP